MPSRLIVILLACAAVAPLHSASVEPTGGARVAREPAPSPPWTARTVEHLFNRAGFGASPAEVRAAVRRSPEDVVDELLVGGRALEAPELEDYSQELRRFAAAPNLDHERSLRERNARQMEGYTRWWIDAMRSGADPLRDRMTLFWQGFFTSSFHKVQRSDRIAMQHRRLRTSALESYRELLGTIVGDAAMHAHLDNDVNRRGALNENFARELLELFSLGEGHYTEQDVRETARALTGMRCGPDGEVLYSGADHDFGEKRVLGVSGPLRAEDVVEILLDRPECAAWVASNLIAYLEGVEPAPERVAHYAALLRAEDYALRPFLRALFLDADFYRDEVVGARVQGPVDYLLGASRRLGLPLSARGLRLATAELGQELFCPPSVAGWPSGLDWITTSHLMMRGNLAGVLLGVVDPAALAPLPREPVPAEVLPTYLDYLRETLAGGFDPGVPLVDRLRVRALDRDAEIAHELLDAALAIEVPRDLHAAVLERLAAHRARLGLADGELLEHPEAEEVLRRLLHTILASPAAQVS